MCVAIELFGIKSFTLQAANLFDLILLFCVSEHVLQILRFDSNEFCLSIYTLAIDERNKNKKENNNKANEVDVRRGTGQKAIYNGRGQTDQNIYRIFEWYKCL